MIIFSKTLPASRQHTLLGRHGGWLAGKRRAPSKRRVAPSKTRARTNRMMVEALRFNVRWWKHPLKVLVRPQSTSRSAPLDPPLQLEVSEVVCFASVPVMFRLCLAQTYLGRSVGAKLMDLSSGHELRLHKCAVLLKTSILRSLPEIRGCANPLSVDIDI